MNWFLFIFHLLASGVNILFIRHSLLVLILGTGKFPIKYRPIELINLIIGRCLLICITVFILGTPTNVSARPSLIWSICSIIHCALHLILFVIEWRRYFAALNGSRFALGINYICLLFTMVNTVIVLLIQNFNLKSFGFNESKRQSANFLPPI